MSYLLVVLIVLSAGVDSLPPPPSYIFTVDSDICVYNGTATEINDLDYECFLEINTYQAISLDVDYEAQVIYIGANGHILQANYSDDTTITGLAWSAGDVVALSKDWISGNLYYGDRVTDAIRVLNHDADHSVTVLEGLQGLNGVAVAPIQRFLFWSQGALASGEGAVIGRSALDGSNVMDQFFINVTSPISIAVDHREQRLYWADDIKGSVESVDLDGNNHVVLLENSQYFPFGLTVSQDYVVWLNNQQWFPEIYWINKTSGEHSLSDDHFALSGLHDVVFYGEYSQPPGHTNVCSDNNGGCAHLCFALSDTERTCRCSLGYALADDDTSCKTVDRGNIEDNILVADNARGSIYFYNTRTGVESVLDIPRQTDIQDVTADPEHEKVFWVNTQEGTMESANFDGSGVTVIKTFPSGHTIVGLAVDTLRQMVFYCDIQDHGVVSSMSYTGTDVREVWHENHTVAIVPDTQNQHLYMAVIGDSKISRIDYDGTNELVIIDNIFKPLTLTIDFTGGRMYWFDSAWDAQYLEWADLSGGNRDRWSVGWANRFFSMAVLGEYIYIADWDQSENQLARVKKGNAQSFELVGTDMYYQISRIKTIVPGSSDSTTTSPSVISSSTTSSLEVTTSKGSGRTDALPSPPSYIFSVDTDICVYNGMATEINDLDYKCFLDINTYEAISLEVDYEAQVIYIGANGHILQANYSDNTTITGLALSAGDVVALSKDWISGNLYYGDRVTDAIRVLNHDADHSVTVLEGLQGLNGVAVAPIQRFLFWSQGALASGEGAVIGRSALDGSNVMDQFFIDVTSPQNIAVDHSEQRIYWTDDIKGSVESVDLEGNNHVVLLENIGYFPSGLAVNRDYVVWLNNRYLFPEIHWTDKTSGDHSLSDYHIALSGLHDVVFYGEYSQPSEHTDVCSDNNGGCAHLCFAVSDTERTCRCSLGYELAGDDISCKTVDRGSLEDNILVADNARGSIYFYNTQTGVESALDIPHQTAIQDVTCDSDHGKVFWANTETGTIESVNFDGSGVTVIKAFPSGHAIVGLAVDTLRQMVFYCDIQDHGVVSSMSYTGTDVREVWHENHTVAIVPDTQNQHLYMALIGDFSKITRIDYDGTNESVIIDDILQPVALTIDFIDEKMYWFALDGPYLEWADLSGGNRDRLRVSWTNRFFSMAVLGEYIYVADWGGNNNQLARVKKGNATLLELVGTDMYYSISRIKAIGTVEPIPTTTPQQDTPPQGGGQAAGQQAGGRSNDPSLIAGVAVAVAVVVIVVVGIAAYMLYRRRKQPSDIPIVNENAFENPGYGEVNGNVVTPPVDGAAVGYSAEGEHVYTTLAPIPEKK